MVSYPLQASPGVMFEATKLHRHGVGKLRTRIHAEVAWQASAFHHQSF
jgi:hypothetical protein